MFPRLVYRTPGPNQRPGGTYDHRSVADEAELAVAVSNGWYETLPDAISGKRPALPDDAPPTRKEMEQKAHELGINVDGRWSDRRLVDEIAKKVK